MKRVRKLILIVSLVLICGIAQASDITIAVLGDSISQTTSIHLSAWPTFLNKKMADVGIDAKIVNCSIGAGTLDSALNDTQAKNGLTQVEYATQFDPDIVLIALGFNDTITSGCIGLEPMLRAIALINEIEIVMPRALVIYTACIPYDINVQDPKKILTNKSVIPFSQRGVTMYGKDNCVSNEPVFLNEDVGVNIRNRYSTWKAMDFFIKTLVDDSIYFDMFRIYRMGFHADKLHPSEMGHRCIAAYVRDGLINSEVITDAYPILLNLKNRWDNHYKFKVDSLFDLGVLEIDSAYTEIGDYFGIDMVCLRENWIYNRRNTKFGYTDVIADINSTWIAYVKGLLPQQDVYISIDGADFNAVGVTSTYGEFNLAAKLSNIGIAQSGWHTIRFLIPSGSKTEACPCNEVFTCKLFIKN